MSNESIWSSFDSSDIKVPKGSIGYYFDEHGDIRYIFSDGSTSAFKGKKPTIKKKKLNPDTDCYLVSPFNCTSKGYTLLCKLLKLAKNRTRSSNDITTEILTNYQVRANLLSSKILIRNMAVDSIIDEPDSVRKGLYNIYLVLLHAPSTILLNNTLTYLDSLFPILKRLNCPSKRLKMRHSQEIVTTNIPVWMYVISQDNVKKLVKNKGVLYERSF